MIFRPELASLVLRGANTETRRPVKYENGEALPCRYKVGRDYAVQDKRGGGELARIEVLYVRQEPLSAIDKFGAIAEGFQGETLWSGGYIRPVEQFFAYWSKLYNEVPVDESREVYVIGFELE